MVEEPKPEEVKPSFLDFIWNDAIFRWLVFGCFVGLFGLTISFAYLAQHVGEYWKTTNCVNPLENYSLEQKFYGFNHSIVKQGLENNPNYSKGNSPIPKSEECNSEYNQTLVALGQRTC